MSPEPPQLAAGTMNGSQVKGRRVNGRPNYGAGTTVVVSGDATWFRRATASAAAPPGLSKYIVRTPCRVSMPPVPGSVFGRVLLMKDPLEP